MLATERADFEKHLKVMLAGLDLPASDDRIEAFWKACMRMPLSVFARTCDYVLVTPEWQGLKKPQTMWAASKEMRAGADLIAEAQERARNPLADEGPDQFEIMANTHLWRYIARRIRRNPRCYGPPASVPAMQHTREPAADASPQLQRAIKHLVDAKKFWAADMRDRHAHTGELPDKATQDEWWLDYLTKAEEFIQRENPEVPC